MTSQLVEKLNEALSTENSSVDRITSRISHTPIQEINQRIKQHLEETHTQRNRLKRIITALGGKPTDVRVELSWPNHLMTTKENLPKNPESKMKGNSQDNSVLEEDELPLRQEQQ